MLSSSYHLSIYHLQIIAFLIILIGFVDLYSSNFTLFPNFKYNYDKEISFITKFNDKPIEDYNLTCFTLKQYSEDGKTILPKSTLNHLEFYFNKLKCTEHNYNTDIVQNKSKRRRLEESNDSRNESKISSKFSIKEKEIRFKQEASVRKCVYIRKTYDIKPGASWGSATKEAKSLWIKNKCERYGAMEPGLIYDGTIPNSYLEAVTDLTKKTNTKTNKKNSDVKKINGKQKEGNVLNDTKTKERKVKKSEKSPSSPLSKDEGKGKDNSIESSLEIYGGHHEDVSYCIGNMKKYNVVPGKSWGSLPKEMRSVWREHSCDVVFSLKRRKGYKMTNCPASNLQNGNGTSNNKKLPLIAIMAASTTRNIKRPSPKTMALFTYLLPSIRTSVDCGFRYVFVMGYDEGDPYHDTDEGQSRTRSWFDKHITSVMASNNIAIDFTSVKFRNTLKKPGPIFIAMGRKAYEYGADFFYRVNDDTELIGRWPAKFTETILSLGPPYGVIGPFCDVNKRILTHDFVHRIHMDIMGMNYYPPALVDWWMDDWATLVYGYHRTFISKSSEVIHHTGAHGQRYQVDQRNLNKLDSLVKEGRQNIRKWMLKHEIPDAVIKNFDKDTLAVYKAGNIKIKTV